MPNRTIAYVFTTFPNSTETFLQREVLAVRQHGINVRLYSLFKGKPEFQGLPVERFNLWRLLTLIWMIPYESCRRPGVLLQVLHGLCTRRPPSWMNFWENMLGAGFACLYARHFRQLRPALIHATWSGAPATAAWLLWRLDGHPFSSAAHAYDIFEHGGDWWLDEKLAHARFIHTSTKMGVAALTARGVEPTRIVLARRGLNEFPTVSPLRAGRDPLRLLCVARLVPKKGLRRQLRIYVALREAGVNFTARIIGKGPMLESLCQQAKRLGLSDVVEFTGPLPLEEVWRRMAWADVLLHTGVVAPNGDQDGLPNVIPEAMAAGALVVTSPTAATTEAIVDGETGLVASVDEPDAWVRALRRLMTDDALAARLQANARRWTEVNYVAYENVEPLVERFQKAQAS